MKLRCILLFWGILLTASCDLTDSTKDIKDITPSEDTENHLEISDTSYEDSSEKELNEGLLEDIDLEYITYSSAPTEYQNLIVVYSDLSAGDISLREQVCSTFDQARMNYSLIEIGDFKSGITACLDTLDSDDILVFSTERLWTLETAEMELLIQKIEAGLNAVFLINSGYGNDTLRQAVGITAGESWVGGSGIKITADIFPGFDDTDISSGDFLTSASIAFTLESEAEVIAQSSEGTPYIWTYESGLGKVLYTNSSLFQGKSFRGLLLQCISLVPDYFISTHYNSALFYIDDFPVSIPENETGDDLLAPYEGMSKMDFINTVWWPDIKNIYESYDLKYTALAVGNYLNACDENDLYEFTDYDRDSFAYHGELLKETGAELGIHGFNHVSLVLDTEFTDDTTSTKWPSESAMVCGLKDLKRMMNSIFYSIPYYSYVPPMNRMSSSGKAALLDVFPGINNVASVNQGIETNGDLIQEIGEDPLYSHWIDIPRFSAGYLLGDDDKWLLYDALAYNGLFSHFIHPDDAMDPVRNEGQSWDSMITQFDNSLDEIFSNFPYLIRRSSAQAAKIVRAQEGMDVYSWKEGNSIKIRYSEGAAPVYNYLRIQPEQSILSVEGGCAELLQSSCGLYLISSTADLVTVNLRPEYQ